MDDQENLYLWMVIATFVALAAGTLFAILEKQDIASTAIQALQLPS